MDRSSRLRSGTLDRISILPPRCSRNVRSLTLCTETPGIAAIAATSDSACAVSVAAQVTSTRSIPRLPELTSIAVTTPPACSTVRVISLTARPCEATSSRAVIEYDTLGAMVTSVTAFPGRHCPARPYSTTLRKNLERSARLTRRRFLPSARTGAVPPGDRSMRSARQRVIFMHGAGHYDKPVGGRPERDKRGRRRDRCNTAAGCACPAFPSAPPARARGSDPDPAGRALD